VESKTCSKCKNTFEISLFAKHSGTKSGISSNCKACIKISQHNYYIKNIDRVRTQQKQYRQENYDKVYFRVKKWRAENKEMYLMHNRTRRSRKFNTSHVPYTEQEVLNAYGTMCHICNTKIDMNAPRQSGKPGWELGLHLDHVIALVDGGADAIDNVKPAHGICNVRKNRH
jgi:hypothetical protein